MMNYKKYSGSAKSMAKLLATLSAPCNKCPLSNYCENLIRELKQEKGKDYDGIDCEKVWLYWLHEDYVNG